MKKFYKSVLMMAAIIASLGFISCSDDDNDVELTEQEKELQKINVAYVNNNVIAIYKTLATETIKLQEAIEDLEKDPTAENMSKACTLWKSSRKYWEWSEAFLFGAASKYNIDPHIDTWPLDKTDLNNLLNNDAMMTNIEKTIANLDNGLVGYHGLEYIIFREGQNRPVAGIPAKELKYAVAVAQDLALSCCRLEAAWAGMDNVTAEKQAIIEDAEMEPEDNFGEQMELAGFAGSTWKTVASASEQIIDGCRTIVDEVGNSKIGAPYTGENTDYIESPHAHNSIQDFYDNITGVQYALYGEMGATSPKALSIFAYIKSVDSKVADELQAALENCLAKINAMPKPFVNNFRDAKVKEAIDACNDLDGILENAKDALK
ncbi:imelysin family protein [Bacteroides sp. 51]|uniref:imelysin family protein n=1 Tax=Bacteroides sp. 51 TaxID=2302938 RepID=UPI0013D3A78D|nr:imelysin family protein [Bacteroides sp. 51]NDV82976.1 peptidase M75 [Bacteroides sp. 51]